MVKFLVLFLVAHLVELFEVAGATVIIVGLTMAWGTPAGLIGGGVFLLLKSFEMDLHLGGGGK